MLTSDAQALIAKVVTTIGDVVRGNPQAVRLTVAGLLAGGHVLFEDVPGVGKTTLARTLAAVFAGQFTRIQFTPDLLPSDITGVNIYNRQTNNFEFRPGPVFTNFLLADEINRATPRTQAALLEAMGERAVTTDGVTRQLGAHFFVLATQNPQAYSGTYPLPEAQLDRFMMALSLGYPDPEAELAMLAGATIITPDQVVDADQLDELAALVKQVHIADQLLRYIIAIATATRNDARIQLGISPRGTLALRDACRAWAVVNGRDYVVADDVQALIVPVLAHRLVVAPGAELGAQACLVDLLKRIPVPTTGKH